MANVCPLPLPESIDQWINHGINHGINQDRVNTSTPFARALGLQDAVLPFSLVLFLAGAMTHADAAQVGTPTNQSANPPRIL